MIISSTRGGASREGTERVGWGWVWEGAERFRRGISARPTNEFAVYAYITDALWRVENSVDFPPDMWIFGMEYRIGDKFGAGVEVNFREQFIFG